MEHWNVWRQKLKVYKNSFSKIKVGKKFLEIKKPSKRSNVPFMEMQIQHIHNIGMLSLLVL
jgi:hypothetical protein